MTTMSKDLHSNEVSIQSSIAVTVMLVSWGMFFATLFLCYAIFRLNAVVWPPMGYDKVALMLPTVSTVIIALSSILFEVYKIQKSKKYLVMTIITGIGFLAAQLILWSTMNENGYYVADGIFPSILYGFTWIHAAHIVLGLMSLFYLQFVKVVPAGWVHHIGKFWHFLGAIWLIMFITIFVL